MRPAIIALIATLLIFACNKTELPATNEVECECAPPGIYTDWWMAGIMKKNGVNLGFSEIEPGTIKLEFYLKGSFVGNEQIDVIESESGNALLVTNFQLLKEYGNSMSEMFYILRTPEESSKPLTVVLDADTDECCTYPFLENILNEHGARVYGMYDDYVENPQIYLH